MLLTVVDYNKFAFSTGDTMATDKFNRKGHY